MVPTRKFVQNPRVNLVPYREQLACLLQLLEDSLRSSLAPSMLLQPLSVAGAGLGSSRMLNHQPAIINQWLTIINHY